MTNQTPITAKMDFQEDYAELCRKELSQDGYTVTVTEPRDIILLHSKYKLRLIPQAVRKVRKAKGLTVPAGYEAGVAEIERKIKAGEDLRPHLSKGLNELNYDDDMLNDWGIFHLHLGTTLDSNGYVNRTGPILYALFTDSTAYFIDILGHGQWTNKGLITILHNEFPESIESHRDYDIEDIEHDLSEAEIKQARGLVNYPIKVALGVIYHSIGGGTATDGSSIKAVTNAHYWMNMMINYEHRIARNFDFVIESLNKPLNEGDTKLDIHFIGFNNDRNKPVAKELKTDTSILIYELPKP